MTRTPDEVLTRARQLVGIPFRPQGRDAHSGLDCVGLILEVFEIPPAGVRRDYWLRGQHLGIIEAELAQRFSRVAEAAVQAGDILLCHVRAQQMHLAIHCGRSFIHADARLRRVVETPGSPPWPIAGVYRRRLPKLRLG